MKKYKKYRKVRINLLRLLILTIIGMSIFIYIVDKGYAKEGYFLINDYNKIVVNKNYTLDEDYIPENLVEVNIKFLSGVTEEERYMTTEAARALENMVNDAASDGIYLYGLSGYRSYETQKDLYEYNLETQGKVYTDKYVAKAGASEHQIGEAMDLSTSIGWISEGCVEANYIAANSYKYGFIVRYEAGKESITGYNYEPWHVRYVGVKMAGEIYENEITLEEYAKIY